MSIGIDARFYGLEHSGLGRYTLNFIQELIKKDQKTEYKIFLTSRHVEDLPKQANITPVACDIPHYSLTEQLKLPQVIESTGVSVFHSLHFNTPIKLKTPLIVTIHDLIKTHFRGADTTTRSAPLYLIKRFGYNYVMENSVKKAVKIVVPSLFVKNDITSTFNISGEKIAVIPEANDVSLQDGAISPNNPDVGEVLGKKYFLFIGNPYPHKNLSLLLKAFSHLKDPQTNLVVVSKSSPFLARVMKPFQNDGRIRIISQVSDNDLSLLYKHARSVVIPSLMEGYGLIGIEALSLGASVIATDIPVFHEVYGTRVAYVDPYEPTELARLLQHVSAKPLSKVEYIHPFTWGDVADSYLRIYDEVSVRLRQAQ